MNKKFLQGKVKQVKENGTITGAIASTQSKDRDGDILIQNGWMLDNFRKNPVLLWSHNPFEVPIGKVLNIDVQNDQLVFDAEFAVEDELGARIFKLVQGGFLNTFSVGYIPKMKNENGDTTQMELLEISVVNIPSNQDARVSRDYKEFMEYEKGVDFKKKAMDAGIMMEHLDHMDEAVTQMESSIEAMRTEVGGQEQDAKKPEEEKKVEVTEEKAGREISAKNRNLISVSIDAMSQAVTSLKELLDTSETPKEAKVPEVKSTKRDAQTLKVMRLAAKALDHALYLQKRKGVK